MSRAHASRRDAATTAIATMQDLSDCRLYGILDLSYVDSSDAGRVAEAMIEGGVDLIQLRGKQKSIDELTALAAKVHEITSRSSIPLIVNDHAQIAQRVPLEGVHVGQDDDPIAVVRKTVIRPLLVGKSTHTVDQATAAFGPGNFVFKVGPKAVGKAR